MVLVMPDTSVGPFLYQSLQMANFFAGAFTLAIGMSLMARSAHARYAGGARGEPYQLHEWLMGLLCIGAGVSGAFGFWPRLRDSLVFFLQSDGQHLVAELTAIFAMFVTIGFVVAIATRRPRRTLMLWIIFFACGVAESLFRLSLTQPVP